MPKRVLGPLRPYFAGYAEDAPEPYRDPSPRHIGRSSLRIGLPKCGTDVHHAEFVAETPGFPALVVSDTACDEPFGLPLRAAIGVARPCGGRHYVGAEVAHWMGGASEAWYADLFVFSFSMRDEDPPRFEGRADVAGHVHEWAFGASDWGGNVFLLASCALRTLLIDAEIGAVEGSVVSAAAESESIHATDSCDLSRRRIPSPVMDTLTIAQKDSFSHGTKSIMGSRGFWRLSTCSGFPPARLDNETAVAVGRGPGCESVVVASRSGSEEVGVSSGFGFPSRWKAENIPLSGICKWRSRSW